MSVSLAVASGSALTSLHYTQASTILPFPPCDALQKRQFLDSTKDLIH